MLTSLGSGQYAAGEKHVVFVDRLYKGAGDKRPVIWCHSAGGDAVEPMLPSNNTLPHLQAITALGVPVIAADFAGVAWGNDTAQARVTDALSYVRTAFGASPTLAPILLGVSMGGLLALNWARNNPTLTRAVALFYPAVNLQAIHDGTGGSGNGATTTEAAYGGSLASFNAAVASHNPSQHFSDYPSVPIKMWYSDSDTVVGSVNQAAFAVGVPTMATALLSGAGHADMTRVTASDVQTFIATYV